jgi:alpha-ribazole phosphatase
VKLWLVRHAAPALAAGLCYGRSDIPAEQDATRAAALALAAVLPRSLPLRCSPLQRCEQLASALCGLRPDLTHNTDLRLAEMDFGRWEGRRWDEISATELAAWTADFARHRPGGGESVGEVMARVAQAWDEARAARHDTVWITHAGAIRAALLLARGQRTVGAASDWPQDAVPFGDWRVVDASGPIPNG